MRQYERYLEKTPSNEERFQEPGVIARWDEELAERFCRELEFGARGLQWALGANANRMNVYKGDSEVVVRSSGTDTKLMGCLTTAAQRLQENNAFAERLAGAFATIFRCVSETGTFGKKSWGGEERRA